MSELRYIAEHFISYFNGVTTVFGRKFRAIECELIHLNFGWGLTLYKILWALSRVVALKKRVSLNGGGKRQ